MMDVCPCLPHGMEKQRRTFFDTCLRSALFLELFFLLLYIFGFSLSQSLPSSGSISFLFGGLFGH